MAKTAYLIDGTAYVFRSFFSIRPMSAPDGTPINAVFGLGMTLQKLLNDRQPTHAAVAFDAGAHTFRNDMYPEYKANRDAPPEELVPQFDLCPQLTEAMGLATVLCPGFEADDVLATLTRRLRARDYDVVVVTGDKDLAQLLGPGVRIWDLAKDLEYDARAVPERMGVRAEQVVDLLALMGDSSDNIPGVAGIGAKGAAGLLAEFDDLEAVYADLERVESLPLRGAKSLRRKLEEGRDAAFLSRELATVRFDAPVELGVGDMSYKGAHDKRLVGFAEQWGLGRIATRVPRQ